MDHSSDAAQPFSPIEVKLEAGKDYFWCTCGRSKSQPFCDGSHKNTQFTPKKFNVTEHKTAWLCTCKRTSNSPYCDGTHRKL
ncbi:CDGSH iron-sulfur domain-containing protein [Nitrosomonas sp. JL21]|uniref:CDGSH iron-sulfur domain-containing protein n=1 Tax=Nitrosomonas sp. JL21 TaxID=153949 RepID=UPI00136CEE36|nr:CDGSH iron-sulfur domain-containing protein [Nitrosomonas sp. JL21]MBL8497806.1 CDGSH iron-sulfur domain-containing protein [Nitrosomonas sp.]MCC7090817.1 CDGSH iron-sulfur domain-containing protein [Nitrosomonas sp.]MXS76753.1 CDGSH iron-sulfur domain-containing protein [Nitrosomonas sp. JL21]